MQYQNIGHLLEQTAARWPANEAIIYEDRRLSYREWNSLVNRLANGLRRLGVREGDHIAIFAYNSLEQVTTHLAVAKCGAVAVLLNFRFTVGELKPLLELTHPSVLVFDSELASVVEQARPSLSTVREWIAMGDQVPPYARAWQEVADHPSDSPPDAKVSDDAAGMMMFTSGTTGLPKAVVLLRRAQWLNAILLVGEMRFHPGDRTLHIAPLFHAAPWDCFFVPHIAVGGTNVILRKFDPERTLALIEHECITNLMGVPTHYELIRQASVVGRYDLASLRYVVATAGPVRLGTVQWIQANICPNVSNLYGLTESTTLITACPPEEMHRFKEAPCIGRSLIGMEVRLVSLDEPMPTPDAVVPVGQPGQLICRGPKLMREYYRNPEKTAERLKDGWLYTGDLCYADEDGYYYILDRVDELISTGGEKVYPAEVEKVLNQHPDIRESVVVGIPDATWGQIIKAYVVTRADRLDAEVVVQWARSRLADYKCPRQVAIVPEIPRGPSGKILKKALRQM